MSDWDKLGYSVMTVEAEKTWSVRTCSTFTHTGNLQNINKQKQMKENDLDKQQGERTKHAAPSSHCNSWPVGDTILLGKGEQKDARSLLSPQTGSPDHRAAPQYSLSTYSA